jgi:hypothetical protein
MVANLPATSDVARRPRFDLRWLLLAEALLIVALVIGGLLIHRDLKSQLDSQDRVIASLLRTAGHASANQISAPPGCEGEAVVWPRDGLTC